MFNFEVFIVGRHETNATKKIKEANKRIFFAKCLDYLFPLHSQATIHEANLQKFTNEKWFYIKNTYTATLVDVYEKKSFAAAKDD